MKTALLLATATESQTLAEKLAIGVEVSVVGILIVFAVLAILWGCLELMHLVIYTIPKHHRAKREVTSSVFALQTAEEVPEVETPAQDDGEVLAAITAAITIMTEKQPGTFRVVSFRRTDNRKNR